MGHVERHNDSYMCPVCRELKDAENQKRFAEYRQRKALEPPTELEKVTAERDALQLANGHYRHTFQTLSGWAQHSDTVKSESIINLLALPIPNVEVKNNEQ
jgi:hypothetical protein